MLTDIITTDLVPRPARSHVANQTSSPTPAEPAHDEHATLRDFMVADARHRQRAQQRPTGGDAA